MENLPAASIERTVKSMKSQLFKVFKETYGHISASKILNRARWYIAMQVSCYAFGAVVRLPVWPAMQYGLPVVIDICDYAYNGTLFILSLATIVVTIKALIVVKKFKASMKSNAAEAAQQRRLISFLIYCIPLNVLNIPLVVFAITFIFVDDITIERIGTIGAMLEYELRTVVISICTLFALTPYRRSMLALFGCGEKSIQKVAPTAMSTTNRG
ncbi:unnamed protein product [Toxocara canis]|uniref:G protein-coupled receptor n=1 Tax=Toxocara canis TaxID=6265 RepID=A0A183V0N9_TOXCA|nr:unnamed protein product [Toxocara canis]